jgi:hypothetical protein
MNDNIPLDERLRIGANNPPAPIEDPAEEAASKKRDTDVAALIAAADDWATNHPVIEDEILGDDANDFLTQLDAFYNEYEAARIKEKRPHDLAAAAVQAKFKPWLDRIDICRRAIAPLLRGWIKLKGQREAEAKQKKLREAQEEQRRADQLAEQAKAGGPGTVTNTIAAREAAAAAEHKRKEAAAIPERPQSRGTLSGRARSLRTVWLVELKDQDLAYQRFRGNPKIKEILYDLGSSAVRAQGGPRPPNGQTHGISPDLPGYLIYSEEQ